MELVLIGVAPLLTSGLTMLSGFGLGTILMPVFALFFPLPLAIAATAVVHFANNLLKFGLIARQADWPVVAKFSMPTCCFKRSHPLRERLHRQALARSQAIHCLRPIWSAAGQVLQDGAIGALVALASLHRCTLVY